MTSTPPIDHYAVLGVSSEATHTQIRAAYRQIMRRVHPDLAGPDAASVARATLVNQSWSVLRNPTARAEYDLARAAFRQAGGASANRVDAADGVPSFGRGGVRPVTVQQFREAAARERAYSAIGRQQRQAFSTASLRLGIAIVMVSAVLLLLTATR